VRSFTFKRLGHDWGIGVAASSSTLSIEAQSDVIGGPGAALIA
jgi:hypothetical protein